jgi:hypothetical protein
VFDPYQRRVSTKLQKRGPHKLSTCRGKVCCATTCAAMSKITSPGTAGAGIEGRKTMPLESGNSPAVISRNVEEMRESNHSEAQSVAAAMREAREHPEADALHHRHALLARHGDDARFRRLQREDDDARRRVNARMVADRALSSRGVSSRSDAWDAGPIRPLSGNEPSPAPTGLAGEAHGAVYRRHR